MDPTAVFEETRRERKKRATRETIVATALRLFSARGFDAVTVAEIAEAADVSEKTVFNHFPAKEDLVFNRQTAPHDQLVAAIDARPPGESLVEPFRRQTHAFLDTLVERPYDELAIIPRLVAGSTALRARLFLGWEREIEVLAPVLAREAGMPEDDLLARIVARSLAWTHRLVFRAAMEGLAERRSRAALAAELHAEADRAYDQLAGGLAGYGAGRV